MPINYEPIDPTTDVATTRTLLHEVIPLTGTIVSGTYGTFPNDDKKILYIPLYIGILFW